METNSGELLQIRNLHIHFHTYKSVVKAVQGINLDVKRGKTLGLVGESGCGKSVTASSVLQLLPSPPAKIVSGEIFFDGEDLLEKSEKQMRGIRGRSISMIFQDPMSSLNPVFSVGDQIKTVIRTHQKQSRGEVLEMATEMLNLVGLPDPVDTLQKFPHELSGGMCQRIMIAMALVCKPALLIADEPTTALDVTVQAQILKLLNDLKDELDTSILLITHDVGVVAQMCQYVAVMYAGHIVEYGTTRHIFKNPRHPYTLGLMVSAPRIGKVKDHLEAIEGYVPDLGNLPLGCPFAPRCDQAKNECQQSVPGMREVEKGHFAACCL